LLAIRLVNSLRELFDIDLPFNAMFIAPTVSQLATTIEKIRGAADSLTVRIKRAGEEGSPGVLDELDVLVAMEPGGKGTPFFWVHGIGGEMFSFMEVSRQMAGPRPIYGFAADWTMIPFEPPLTVEQMAARYVQRLRRVQAQGPYFLGGFCAGALIALEIARKLEIAGEHVGLLAVVDGALDIESDQTPLRPIEFFRNLPRWILEDAVPSGGGQLVGRLSSRWRRLVGPRTKGIRERADIRDELGMWQFPDEQVPMLELHSAAIKRYVPGPTKAKVVLLIPGASPLLGPASERSSYGWQQYAEGGLDVHVLPGSHATLLTLPYVASLAERLNRTIETAESALGSSVLGSRDDLDTRHSRDNQATAPVTP
jgi:thioesterase domain-containing protein